MALGAIYLSTQRTDTSIIKYWFYGEMMRNVAAADIKQHFAQYLDSALIEPIVIENSGHPSVVMLSIVEYERLQSLDDSWWGKKAQLALESGFVGTDESMQRIQERLNAEA